MIGLLLMNPENDLSGVARVIRTSSRRTNDWKAGKEAAEADGVHPILQEELDLAHECAASLRQSPHLAELLEGLETTVNGVHRQKIADEHSIASSIPVVAIRDQTILTVTVRSVENIRDADQAIRNAKWADAAIFDGLCCTQEPGKSMAILAIVEKQQPYCTRLYTYEFDLRWADVATRVGQAFIDIGTGQIQSARHTIQEG